MKIINKATLLLLASLLTSSLLAQHKHEFSIWGAGGLSTLKYKTSIGKQKNGLGGAVGLGYTYFFSENWGLGTGAELALYNASTNLAGFKDSYDIKDVLESEDANLRISMNKYKEKQKLMSVNIPLFLQFQSNGNHKFYATVGAKVGLPIEETFKVSGAEYKISAYYPSTNQELFDPMYPAGYGLHKGVTAKGDLDFKLAWTASAEAGMKWRIGEKYALYTGAYLDYGINNINKTSVSADKRIVEYNKDNKVLISHNSVFNYAQAKGQDLNRTVDKVRPMAVGIKVKFAFGAGSVKKAEKVDPIYVEPAKEIVEPVKDLEAERLAREKAEAEQARLKKEADERKRKEEDERIGKEMADAVVKVNFVLNDYRINEADISSTHKNLMDASIAILKQYPDFKVDLVGHTCDLGTPHYNLWLSKRRAEQVKQYLIGQGIDADRISVKGVGGTQPDKPNTSGENRLHNRRVEAKGHR